MSQPQLFSLAKTARAVRSLLQDYNAGRERGACFECSKYTFCHRHHVVPRSKGGRMMVLLCEGCHSKVHDINFVNHTTLIRAGLERAKRKGVVLGRPVGSTVAPEVLLGRHADILKLLRVGHTIRNVAKLAGKGGSAVQRVKAAGLG